MGKGSIFGCLVFLFILTMSLSLSFHAKAVQSSYSAFEVGVTKACYVKFVNDNKKTQKQLAFVIDYNNHIFPKMLKVAIKDYFKIKVFKNQANKAFYDTVHRISFRHCLELNAHLQAKMLNDVLFYKYSKK